MDTIGIRELRSNLSRVIRTAAAGHTVLVTQHGEPCAQVGPVGAGHADIDGLVARGAVVPPRRRKGWRWPVTTEVAVGTRVDVALRDLRG